TATAVNQAAPTNSAVSGPANAPTGPVNILLMGLDDRPGADDGARADTLMVVHIPAAHDRVSVLSIPRDAMVEIPGHGVNKANSAYSFGGPTLTATTVSTLTGLHIDH